MTTFSLADYSIEQALDQITKRVNRDIDKDLIGVNPISTDRVNKLKHSHRKLNAYILYELDGENVEIMKTDTLPTGEIASFHLLDIEPFDSTEWDTGVLSLRTISRITKLAVDDMIFRVSYNKTRYFYSARIIKVGELLKLELRYIIKYNG